MSTFSPTGGSTGTVTTAPIVRAVGMAKQWDATSGLQPVTFDLHPGETVVVRGRSGSGKSTLLALLAGWTEPDAGTLDRIGSWAANGEWERWHRTAVLPQVLAPITELSMIENVALPLRLTAMGWTEARQRATDVLASLDLADEAPRPATDASLGQQQRLALARAIVARPTLLLADEPTSHQDAGHVELVLARLADVAAHGGTVVVATHDPAVGAIADRIIDLDD